MTSGTCADATGTRCSARAGAWPMLHSSASRTSAQAGRVCMALLPVVMRPARTFITAQTAKSARVWLASPISSQTSALTTVVLQLFLVRRALSLLPSLPSLLRCSLLHPAARAATKSCWHACASHITILSLCDTLLGPGSHKSAFTCPEALALFDEDQEAVRVIEADAGDVVLFLEATLHGSVPWRAEGRQRRSLIYRCAAFSPSLTRCAVAA